MKPLIVANWKMNPQTLAEAKEIFDRVAEGTKDVKNAEVVICPPFVYLASLASAFANASAGLRFGSQDCFWEEKGAYTGEVSPEMLKDSGCEYVILGHSERRKLDIISFFPSMATRLIVPVVKYTNRVIPPQTPKY